MPGYTSHYSIQYPLVGDPIYMGAMQMKWLADGVDAALWGAGVPPLTLTDPPSCSVIRTTTLSCATGTDVQMVFTAAAWDTELAAGRPAMKDGTAGLIIRAGGIYSVEASAFFAANGTGRRNVRIMKNGTTSAQTVAVSAMNAVSWENVPTVTAQLKLSIGDTLRMAVAQDSGAALTVGPGVGTTSTRLTATFLRPA